MKKIKTKLIYFFKGFAMGSVDIIPGISGGTMALILGIYEKLIKELKAINLGFLKLLLNLKIKEAFSKINLGFLLPLFSGIIIAIIGLAKVISYLLQNHSSYLYGFFFGLIIASIFIILPKKFYRAKNSLFLIPGFILAWIISGSNSINSANTYLNIFISGILAICAMILPGISGSFILLILGKYEFMISVLKNPFISGNLVYLLVFALGCIFGLASFIKLLDFLFKKYKEQSMAILIGFMSGALRKIWPFGKITNIEIDRSFIIILLLVIAGIFVGIQISKIKKV
jgi:putative membrane protein